MSVEIDLLTVLKTMLPILGFCGDCYFYDDTFFNDLDNTFYERASRCHNNLLTSKMQNIYSVMAFKNIGVDLIWQPF